MTTTGGLGETARDSRRPSAWAPESADESEKHCNCCCGQPPAPPPTTTTDEQSNLCSRGGPFRPDSVSGLPCSFVRAQSYIGLVTLIVVIVVFIGLVFARQRRGTLSRATPPECDFSGLPVGKHFITLILDGTSFL